MLPPLLARVAMARSRELHELHQVGARPELVRAARLDTLLALNDYSHAIEALNWPVPRSIQLEINLHRALLEPTPTF